MGSHCVEGAGCGGTPEYRYPLTVVLRRPNLKGVQSWYRSPFSGVPPSQEGMRHPEWSQITEFHAGYPLGIDFPCLFNIVPLYFTPVRDRTGGSTMGRSLSRGNYATVKHFRASNYCPTKPPVWLTKCSSFLCIGVGIGGRSGVEPVSTVRCRDSVDW